jgi:YD repeat-containing protein
MMKRLLWAFLLLAWTPIANAAINTWLSFYNQGDCAISLRIDATCCGAVQFPCPILSNYWCNPGPLTLNPGETRQIECRNTSTNPSGLCGYIIRMVSPTATNYPAVTPGVPVITNYLTLGTPGDCTSDVDGTGGSDGSDGGCGGNSGGCDCGGMPVWNISEPYLNLWFRDEPLGYQPVKGSRISLALGFKEREYSAGMNTNFFSVGKRWNFQWLSYITNSAGVNWIHFPDGRERTFQGTNDYLTNTRLTGDTTNGFTAFYPDGSQAMYGFIVTNSSRVFQQAFLTEHWSAQGQKTRFYYSTYNATTRIIRLKYVVDGDGRTNTISYVTSNAYSTNLISQVTDPYGRSASFAYDSKGHLTNITDVASISSSFTYNSGDLVTNLATPYGNTGFTVNSGLDSRSVLVTQPDGGHQLYLYQSSTPGLAVTNQLPDTSPFSNTFDNTNLDLRNSFYWGPRQYAALPATNVASFTTNDFLKGRTKHWLRNNARPVGDTLSMMREPSPDSGGTIEGQKTWYDYAGKTNNAYEGTQVLPLFVAQVLPDGTTRFTRSLRNDFGAVTNEISTYSP